MSKRTIDRMNFFCVRAFGHQQSDAHARDASGSGPCRQTQGFGAGGLCIGRHRQHFAQQASARQGLSRSGGMGIGHAEGQIIAGEGVDFDPLAP